METNPSSATTSQATADQEDSPSDPLVADPILVPDVVGDAKAEQTNIIVSDECQDDSNRMALIRRIHEQEEGLSEEAITFLIGAQRVRTQKAYDHGEYNVVQNVLNFLIDNQQFSAQYLNTIRSSIASVFKYLHPHQPPIATQQPLIQNFFTSRRKHSVKEVPAEHELMTWNTDVVINYLKETLPNNADISLTKLQQKTIILFLPSELTGALIHFREPKETQVKSCTIGVAQETRICPVTTLSISIRRTAAAGLLREELPPDHTLFLAYIKDSTKTCSARGNTVANWVKDIMHKAGIDTNLYRAHSTRSTSSTKAVQQGHTIDQVKDHANWSRNSQTLEKFYYKPTTRQSMGSQITNSIFSTDNLTTLEAVAAEATEIVIGTTNNQNVAGAKAENVINLQPWYKFCKPSIS